MNRESAPSQLVDRFVTHLQVERGASPHTVRAYSADLGRYLEWAERSHIDPVHLTHRQLRQYLAELDRARYARATVARRLSAVRSWFSYLTAEGVIDSDPSAVLSAPKLSSRLPRIAPSDELSALLAAPNTSTPEPSTSERLACSLGGCQLGKARIGSLTRRCLTQPPHKSIKTQILINVKSSKWTSEAECFPPQA
jgi:integrase/recombinase XerD